jgi:hypothetical protein
MQLVFAIWTGILLGEIENPPIGPKKKTLGEMLITSNMIPLSIWGFMCGKSCNLPVPDEGELLCKLKR